MARIVVLEHLHQRNTRSVIMVYAERWRAWGHEVVWCHGYDAPPGDVAILHLDVSKIPEMYQAVCRRYERVVNGRVLDITKRTFSQCLLERGEPWDGPVILKTNFNHGGVPELLIHQRAKSLGQRADVEVGPVAKEYPVFDSVGEAPPHAWDAPGIVVEKFMPERDEDGMYCLRMWTFFGDRSRCVRCKSNERIVKSTNIVSNEPADPPTQLPAWREKLGFDFGKFDYVVHDGREYLLDVNRTPSFGPETPPEVIAASTDALAPGILSFLNGQ